MQQNVTQYIYLLIDMCFILCSSISYKITKISDLLFDFKITQIQEKQFNKFEMLEIADNYYANSFNLK